MYTYFVLGIILSHEQLEAKDRGETEQQYMSSTTNRTLHLPTYAKKVDSMMLSDEELPPYSVVAPDANPKRRRRHDAVNMDPSEVQDMKISQKEKQEHLNCQKDAQGECVWLHNLSQIPVFVTSPTLGPIPSNPTEITTVKKGNAYINASVFSNYSKAKAIFYNYAIFFHL